MTKKIPAVPDTASDMTRRLLAAVGRDPDAGLPAFRPRAYYHHHMDALSYLERDCTYEATYEMGSNIVILRDAEDKVVVGVRIEGFSKTFHPDNITEPFVYLEKNCCPIEEEAREGSSLILLKHPKVRNLIVGVRIEHFSDLYEPAPSS